MNKLISFAKQFTKETIPELSKAEKIGRQYFLLDSEIASARNKLQENLNSDPYCAGLFLGELRNGRLQPGFPFLDAIERHNPKQVIVNKKGETMFLYSNSLLPESIIQKNADRGMVLVVNEKKEVLGYGEIKSDRNGNLLITNELNRSNFLKREGNKGKLQDKKKKKR